MPHVVVVSDIRGILSHEPTAYLDLAHQYEMLRLIRDQIGRGTGIFMILHDINLAAQFADRMLLLNQGRVEAVGDPSASACGARHWADCHGRGLHSRVV